MARNRRVFQYELQWAGFEISEEGLDQSIRGEQVDDVVDDSDERDLHEGELGEVLDASEGTWSMQVNIDPMMGQDGALAALDKIRERIENETLWKQLERMYADGE